MAKTKYLCTACSAVGDRPEIIEHCVTATASTGEPHEIAGLKKQPEPITAAHERVTRRAAVREQLATALGMPIEDIEDALRGA